MRKHVRERRDRNRQLALRDRANRCTLCKVALTGTTYISALTPGRFCSEDCQERAVELDRMQAGS